MPNGELTVQQLRFLGDAIAPFGDAGCGDITTRANVQLRGLTLAEADQVFAGLQRVGMSSVQTGAQNPDSDPTLLLTPRCRLVRAVQPRWNQNAELPYTLLAAVRGLVGNPGLFLTQASRRRRSAG